jgi:hypothetical protein
MKLPIKATKYIGSMKVNSKIILLIILFALGACSSGGDDAPTGGGPANGDLGNGDLGNNDQGNNSGGDQTSNSGSAANLIGTWSLDCQTSFTTILSVDATNYDATTSVYSDPTCAAGTETFTDFYENTYTIGQQITSTNSLPATELNVEVVAIERTLHTDFFVQAYNANNACGYSDWQRDVAKDITGRDCGQLSGGCVFDSSTTVCNTAGTVTYTIYGIDDTGTQMMVGTPSPGRNGSSVETRMNTLLTFVPFTKQ